LFGVILYLLTPHRTNTKNPEAQKIQEEAPVKTIMRGQVWGLMPVIPSYSGKTEIQKAHGLKPAQENSPRPYLKNIKVKRTEGVAQVVEPLTLS
jgi:hypothetical protein